MKNKIQTIQQDCYFLPDYCVILLHYSIIFYYFPLLCSTLNINTTKGYIKFKVLLAG